MAAKLNVDDVDDVLQMVCDDDENDSDNEFDGYLSENEIERVLRNDENDDYYEINDGDMIDEMEIDGVYEMTTCIMDLEGMMSNIDRHENNENNDNDYENNDNDYENNDNDYVNNDNNYENNDNDYVNNDYENNDNENDNNENDSGDDIHIPNLVCEGKCTVDMTTQVG